MIVVDASALLEVLLRTPAAQSVERAAVRAWRDAARAASRRPRGRAGAPPLCGFGPDLRRARPPGAGRLAAFRLRRWPHEPLILASGVCATISWPTTPPMSRSPRPSTRPSSPATAAWLARRVRSLTRPLAVRHGPSKDGRSSERPLGDGVAKPSSSRAFSRKRAKGSASLRAAAQTPYGDGMAATLSRPFRRQAL